MQTRSYPRATEPDKDAVADAIRAHMNSANTGSFYVSWTGQSVVIEAANLANVNDATVQAAVTAAPAPTNLANVKRYIDNMSGAERANYLTILDQVNVIRSKLVPPLAAITVAQYIAAVKAKADTIILDRPEKP